MPDSSMADSARSALDQALTRVGATAEEQLADLQECLALIDNALPHVTDDWSPTSEEEWWLALHRLQALQHLDRLHTSQALCKG